MSFTVLPTLLISGNTYTIDGDRLTNGGAVHSNVIGLLLDLVNSANGTVPFTTSTVANGDTVNLSSAVLINVLRTTSDGTIAGAVINLPTNPVDGQLVAFSTTGAITTVTGTISTVAALPVTTTLTAGQVVKLRYNTAAGAWFHV